MILDKRKVLKAKQQKRRKKLEQLKQEKMLQMQKHLNKLLGELQQAKKMIYQILELNLIKMEK